MRHLLSTKDLSRDDALAHPRHRRGHGRRRRARGQEAAHAARQDRRQPLLRGLDAHPHLVRSRGQAPERRRHQLLREGLERLEGREPARTPRRRSQAMGADAVVIRHGACGAPRVLADSGWIDAGIVNAGDGTHEHPTQALLDAFTIRRRLHGDGSRGKSLDGVTVTIVGDILHSRVARSNVWLLSTLGAEVTLVAPATLLPVSIVGLAGARAATTSTRRSPPSPTSLMMLRIQPERMNAAFFPNAREYSRRWGLDDARLARLAADSMVMHPGPMNRGLEISAERRRLGALDRARAGGERRLGADGGAVHLLSANGGRTHEHFRITRRDACPTATRRRPVRRRRRVRRGTDSRAGARRSMPTGSSRSPGLVDLHTHLREPGFEQSETVLTGSRAAAAGGYTAVFAMPNTCPCRHRGRRRAGARARRAPRLRHGAARSAPSPSGSKGERLAEIGAMAESRARVRVFSDDGILRVGPADHAPRARVREDVRRRHRPARAGPAPHRGRPDERGRALGRARPRGLARRRRGVDHRPRRAARRARRIAAARLPPLDRGLGRDHPLGKSAREWTSPPRSLRTTCC